MTLKPLEADKIRAALAGSEIASLVTLDVFTEIDSTNSWLATQSLPAAGHTHVAVADIQTQGRGRGGRRWELPAGAGLCLSVLRQPPSGQASLAPLSLIVGMTICQFLKTQGVASAQVKWPNDLVANERKIAGILTELPAADRLIVGVGLNVALPDDFRVQRDPGALPAGDLASAGLAPAAHDRNHLAAGLIESLIAACDAFQSEETATLLQHWDQADYLKNKSVRCGDQGATVSGTARGVAADGALRVETDGGKIAPVTSGSVTLAAIS